MGSPNEPTLADDEAELARISELLLAKLVAVIPEWVARTLRETVASASPDGAQVAASEPDVASVVESTVARVMPSLQAVLAADVDAGAGSPLEVLRQGVGPMTSLLQQQRVAPPPIDEFVARRFPDDPYQLGPATFADVDPELHELGLMWGAARAHVHLRRRREAAHG
jgi:hypothetical protein